MRRLSAAQFSSCFRFGSQFDGLGGMQWHLTPRLTVAKIVMSPSSVSMNVGQVVKSRLSLRILRVLR